MSGKITPTTGHHVRWENYSGHGNTGTVTHHDEKHGVYMVKDRNGDQRQIRHHQITHVYIGNETHNLKEEAPPMSVSVGSVPLTDPTDNYSAQKKYKKVLKRKLKNPNIKVQNTHVGLPR